jgi:hypothetical protein
MSKRAYKLLPNILRCSRLFIVLLAIVSLCFVPFHVLTEEHIDSHVELAQDHDEHDADRDDEGHVPHPEDDHCLDALTTGKVKIHTAALLCVLLTAPDTSIKPSFSFTHFGFRVEIPPEESPPDPLQPRAPPAV